MFSQYEAGLPMTTEVVRLTYGCFKYCVTAMHLCMLAYLCKIPIKIRVPYLSLKEFLFSPSIVTELVGTLLSLMFLKVSGILFISWLQLEVMINIQQDLTAQLLNWIVANGFPITGSSNNYCWVKNFKNVKLLIWCLPEQNTSNLLNYIVEVL